MQRGELRLGDLRAPVISVAISSIPTYSHRNQRLLGVWPYFRPN